MVPVLVLDLMAAVLTMIFWPVEVHFRQTVSAIPSVSDLVTAAVTLRNYVHQYNVSS